MFRKQKSLSGYLTIVMTELPRFLNLSIQLSYIHSLISSFSHFLSFSFSPGMYTYLRTDIS